MANLTTPSQSWADQEPRFYMTYWRSRPNVIVPYAEREGIGLLENAMHRWSDAKEAFLPMWEYSCPHVIDSGGYNAQRKFGDYPWSVEEYHEWLDANSAEIEWAAMMDYACATGDERTGPDAFANDWTTEQRMDNTLWNAIEHLELVEDQYGTSPRDWDYYPLPILQGLSLEDFLRMYDLYRAYSIPTEFLGVGTVVRLSSTNELVELERDLRDQTSVERLHGFGVKADSFKRGAAFESADSQVWTYAPSYGMTYTYQGEGDDVSLVKRKPAECECDLERDQHAPYCVDDRRPHGTDVCLTQLDDQGRKLESFGVYHEQCARLQRQALADRDLL